MWIKFKYTLALAALLASCGRENLFDSDSNTALQKTDQNTFSSEAINEYDQFSGMSSHAINSVFYNPKISDHYDQNDLSKILSHDTNWNDNLAGWRILFKPGRPGFVGGVLPAKQIIEIYLNPELPLDLYKFTFDHELAHAKDVTCNNFELRETWKRIRGFEADTPWFGIPGQSDFDVPAGDFAESYAYAVNDSAVAEKFFKSFFKEIPPLRQRTFAIQMAECDTSQITK